MKNILVICMLTVLPVYYSTNAFAVGGISNSKIIVPGTDTVPKKRVEIEPFANLNHLQIFFLLTTRITQRPMN